MKITMLSFFGGKYNGRNKDKQALKYALLALQRNNYHDYFEIVAKVKMYDEQRQLFSNFRQEFLWNTQTGYKYHQRLRVFIQTLLENC